ncbi:MAG: hemerythrin domain-containing protein [Propionibacteriaceae bacterium]
MDICELILSDHHEQRRMFALLDDVDRSDTETLGLLWSRLSTVLEVHAEAEEELFYPELLKLGERLHTDDAPTETTEADETKDAIGDHNDIRDGILAAARASVGTEDWWAGVSAAREANDEHMGEEEHEGLTDFRRFVDLETRHRIAVAFAAYEARHVTGVPIVDKDPQEYVEENL